MTLPKSTNTWITFVGEGRSGHTIVSAILGSHPNIKMAEEQKYIGRWARSGLTKEQIFDEVMLCGEGRARRQLGFPNITTPKNPLLCIGDKCGWDAVNEVKKRDYQGDILADFGQFMGLQMKVIVTLRNPLDNISAWYQSNKMKRLFSADDLRCRRMIRRYKQFHDVAEKVIQGHDTFFLYNEELINDPAKTTSDLCAWLGIPCNKEWQNMCVGKVFKKPHQRRDEASWPEGYKEERLLGWLDENSMMAYYKGKV